jgi:hypothetical protein
VIRRLLAVLVRPASVRSPAVDDTAIDIPAYAPNPSLEQLAKVQGLCRQWLVMWCPYRREYMAVARFGSEPLILFDRDPKQLVFQCRAAELAVPIS